MRNLIETVLSVTVFLCGISPHAAAAAQKGPCSTAQNQFQLTRCWSQVAADAERRMMETLSSTVAQLRERGAASAADLIQQAQDKWENYRDAECAAVSKLYEGGSIEAMQRASCRARLSDQRRTELDAVVADWGGRQSTGAKGRGQ